MNVQYGLRAEMGLAPLPCWQQTSEPPTWIKNTYVKLRKTILKSVLKLKPNGTVNWRNYGRCIGIMERYKTFLFDDVPKILKAEGFDKITKKEWKRIQPLLSEDQLRQHCFKILSRSSKAKTSLADLVIMVHEKQLEHLEKHKQIAFQYLTSQDAKTTAMFIKGMGEGYTTFLNDEGQFSGDDRRADIHLELIAWQHDIENMRKSCLPNLRKNLFGELKKLPEFKNKSRDWFDDVCKDIKLPLGKVGRPSKTPKNNLH